MIGHLNDPGAGRTFGAVKEIALSLDKQEKILHEIFSLGCVAQDARAYASNYSRIPVKKGTEGILFANLEALH
jgi:hypothetical protein